MLELVKRAVREVLLEDQGTPEEAPGLLSAREMATRLGVHPVTFYRWSRGPGFPRVHVGPHAVRFDFAAVSQWLGGQGKKQVNSGRRTSVLRDKSKGRK